MQYTIRNIPKNLDAALRERARAERKSLNRVAVEVLTRGLGLEAGARRQRDVSDLVGDWPEDPAFDEAIADQRRIDPDLW